MGASGVHAVTGALYVYAYTEDVLRLTPNETLQLGPELGTLSCDNVFTNLVDSHRAEDIPRLCGRVHFGGDGSRGYTPCGVTVAPICQLTHPNQISFGDVAVGSYRDITVQVGVDVDADVFIFLSQPFEVPRPLQLLQGEGAYHLLGGQLLPLTVRYSPSHEGDQKGVLFLSGQCANADMPITGRGVSISVIPADRAWLAPGTLNTLSPGPWIKALLELPEPFLPENLVVSSVSAFDSIPADSSFFEIGDSDSNGVQEAAVRFSRASLIRNVPSNGEFLTVPIRGSIGPATMVVANPQVKIVRPHVSRPASGDVLMAGTFQPILWEIPSGWSVNRTEFSYSLDAGASWALPVFPSGDGNFVWHVPDTETDQALVRIAAYDAFGLLGFGDSGPFTISHSVGTSESSSQALLLRNSPNPFTRATAIRFSLKTEATILLQILDVQGHVVRILAQGSIPSGAHEFAWDGRDASGRTVSNGMYLCHLSGGNVKQTQRMLKIG